MLRQIDALTQEANAFHLEPHALLQAGLELQLDRASGSDDTLPRQVAMAFAQQRGDVPVIQRVAGGGRHLSVGGDLAARDLADRFTEGGQLAPFDEARPRVLQALVGDRRRQLVSDWVAGLRKRAEISDMSEPRR